jgi:hypothetical protein
VSDHRVVLASQPPIVLDANFYTQDERLRHRISARPARLVEVHCACPVPAAACGRVSPGRRGR